MKNAFFFYFAAAKSKPSACPEAVLFLCVFQIIASGMHKLANTARMEMRGKLFAWSTKPLNGYETSKVRVMKSILSDVMPKTQLCVLSVCVSVLGECASISTECITEFSPVDK